MAKVRLDKPKNIQYQDLYEFVKNNYSIYGKEVNLNRGFPHVCDGLKPVYRKILLALNSYTSIVKTNIVIAETMQKYYDHGDASLSPVVSMLVRNGIFIGDGNHGSDLLIKSEPAAMRYTKTGMNSMYREYFFKLLNYSPKFINDNNIEEPEYLITPVPYSLIYGSKFDIGIGAGGRIPAFTFESLINAYIHNDYDKLVSKYEPIVYSQSDLRGLWENGQGRITYRLNVTREWSNDDNQEVIIINGPEGSNTPNLSKIDDWLDNGWLWYRDESSQKVGIKLVIGKTSRTRTIWEDDIYNEAVRAATYGRTFRIVVNVFGKLKKIGIKDWLDITMSNYMNTLNEWKTGEINKINSKIEEYTYLVDVAKLLMENKSNSEISKQLKISEDLVNRINKKSLRTLRRDDFTTEIRELEDNISAIKSITSEGLINLFKSELKFTREIR